MSSHEGVFASSSHAGRGFELNTSIIRDRLRRGDVRGAAVLLGRPWTIEGIVMHGDKRGRELGFATANLFLESDDLIAQGVYAVRVKIDGVSYDAVACYGTRPQFDDGAPRLEVHILDFDADIYGEPLVVEFIGFQRPEERFPSVEALKEQMALDCTQARRLLRETQDASGFMVA